MNRDVAVLAFPAVGRVAAQHLVEMDNIAAMTEDMLSMVTEGNWDALQAMQEKRDALLRVCFSAPLIEEDSVLAASKIQHLLDQNEELVAAVAKAKAILIKNRNCTRRDIKAVNSYLSLGS